VATAVQAIRFILDDEIIEAHGVAPTTTLLQYLRNTLGRTGSKEGCAEGDCGACTVVLGELDGESIRYRSVNACIQFLPTVDGKEVVTVESLSKNPTQPLHPVQQALVDQHASQCGFCTPGFVMSLFDLYLNQPGAQRAQVLNALSGNLCRCTGYRPIIDAGCQMHSYPTPARWSAADAHSDARRQQLLALQRSETLSLDTGYIAPRSLSELADRYLTQPDALLLAGGTDIGLWVTKQLRSLPTLIYLGEIVALQQISERNGLLEIGAAVRLEDAYAALVAHYPMLDELHRRFASPPIRHAATLCGNLANGSPIGDSMPILIALGAQLLLRRGDVTRTLALEDFYLGYQKKALQAGEFIEAVHIPLPHPNGIVASYKIAKRTDQDISAVCGAYQLDIAQGRIRAARIAYGGMAAIPQRASRTEARLVGQPWSLASVRAAAAALAEDFTPLSDLRASADYRLTVAQNLLQRLYLEHAEPGVTIRLSQLDGAIV
jgi:xanthine dehydrogenase small subunit